MARSFRPTSTNRRRLDRSARHLRGACSPGRLHQLSADVGSAPNATSLTATEIFREWGFFPDGIHDSLGRFRCSFLLVTIVLSMATGPGCGDGKPSIDTSLNEATVTGIVSANGVPATGGTILFN